MTTVTAYTITEALQELKLLTKRINKIIEQSMFVGVKRADDANQNVCADAARDFQSVQDLIDRRAKIKSAIMQSNAVTKVEIDHKTYTVCEVIAHKSFINEQKMLLQTMKDQYLLAQTQINNYNADRQRKIDTLIQTTFGRDNSKTSPEDIKTITETYVKKYNIDLVDPLKIKDKIDQLESDIERFENSCDFKLSYINAVTMIQV
jgi:hypothetical protein